MPHRAVAMTNVPPAPPPDCRYMACFHPSHLPRGCAMPSIGRPFNRASWHYLPAHDGVLINAASHGQHVHAWPERPDEGTTHKSPQSPPSECAGLAARWTAPVTEGTHSMLVLKHQIDGQLRLHNLVDGWGGD